MNNPEFWIAADWPAPEHVHAGTRTRHGGLSCGQYAECNLSTEVGDDRAAVTGNRRRLGSVLSLPTQPVWLRQAHGDHIVDISQPGNLDADAACTSRPGQVCAVLTADCVPVVLCDRQGTWIAAVHAGWRGLSGRLLAHTVARCPAARQDILVWMGPHICATHYEVGKDVISACSTACRCAEGTASVARSGKWRLNMAALVRSILQELDVREIYGCEICTFADVRRCYSYRRDGTTGRMATLIWMSD